MDNRTESWVAAERLIAKHGHFAAYDTARREAARLSERGLAEQAAVWRLVEGAILELRPAASSAAVSPLPNSLKPKLLALTPPAH